MKDKDRLHPNPKPGPALMLVMARLGTRLVALRCAGFNNGDLAAAKSFGIAVTRVPACSPHAVAEPTVGLLPALNHKIHCACNRVRKLNMPSAGGMPVNILVGIFIVPCVFCAVAE